MRFLDQVSLTFLVPVVIALRMRLSEERTTALRIEKTGRGRFRLEVARELALERLP